MMAVYGMIAAALAPLACKTNRIKICIILACHHWSDLSTLIIKIILQVIKYWFNFYFGGGEEQCTLCFSVWFFQHLDNAFLLQAWSNRWSNTMHRWYTPGRPRVMTSLHSVMLKLVFKIYSFVQLKWRIDCKKSI